MVNLSFRKTGNNAAEGRRFYDYSLLFVILFLCVFGLIMVFSTSSYIAELKYGSSWHFVRLQGLYMVIGFIAMILVSKINYRIWAKVTIIAWLGAVFLMCLVNYTPLGVEYNGKKRWLSVAGRTIQPTEFVKVAIILCMAYGIVYYSKKIERIRVHLFLLALMAVPSLLVAQNNLSSGIICGGIAVIMLFVACRNKTRFLVIAGVIIVTAVLVILFRGKLAEIGLLQDYQVNRIEAWLYPAANADKGSYQTLQSLYAIGSGGMFGRGLGNSIQKLGFVPEAQNDMIFAIVCEELGLFGALCLILLYIFLLWRMMIIANNAPNLFGSMLVVGVMAQIALQVVLNIAVVTNVIPNTGVSLPFISYGGTSVIILMAEMGLVLGVSNQIYLKAPMPRRASASAKEEAAQ